MRRSRVPLDLNSPGLCLKTKHFCRSAMETLSPRHVKGPLGQYPVLRDAMPQGNQAGDTITVPALKTLRCVQLIGVCTVVTADFCLISNHFIWI